MKYLRLLLAEIRFLVPKCDCDRWLSIRTWRNGFLKSRISKREVSAKSVAMQKSHYVKFPYWIVCFFHIEEDGEVKMIFSKGCADLRFELGRRHKS